MTIKNSFSRKNLNEKMRTFITFMISVLMALSLFIFMISTIRSSYNRSVQEASAQVDFMSVSYTTWLNSVDNLMSTMLLEKETQEFCASGDENGEEYQLLYTDLSDYLNRYKYVSNDVNFITIINGSTGNYVYSGKGVGIFSYYFEEFYADSFEASREAKTRGSLTVDYGYEYANGKFFTITFYQPIYSSTILDQQLGMACVNLSDSILSSTSTSGNIEYCLTDNTGSVILSTDSERMENRETILEIRNEEAGNIVKNGYIYVYKQVSGWNFYVVSVTPLWELYKDSVKTAILIVILTIVLLIVGLWIMRCMIDRSYQPLQKIMDVMDSVSQNHLDTRIETKDMGPDFEKVGSGFNDMMNEIQDLMNRLLKEQHQSDQIRFNALQSQIQPHFLYNTLDTIHWQAKMDGKQEMSDLVMILAKYYRICLSRGKDIIPLSTELEQISYYLQIQNTRFGDIITYETDVPKDLQNVKVPKLTLQPLVENSIYHGIRIKEGLKGVVCVKAGRTENGILIQVIDDGKGMREEQIRELNQSIQNFDEELGYGVRNVNRRIQLLFGEFYGLYYHANPDGGVIADILLPEEYEEESGGIQNV